MDEIDPLMKEAVASLHAGDYEAAEEAFALALESAQNHRDEADPMTASLLGHLARACFAQADRSDRSSSPDDPAPDQGQDRKEKAQLASSLLEKQLHLYENEPALQSLLAERLACLQDLTSVYRRLGRGADADTVAASQISMSQ